MLTFSPWFNCYRCGTAADPNTPPDQAENEPRLYRFGALRICDACALHLATAALHAGIIGMERERAAYLQAAATGDRTLAHALSTE